jgi:membrane associated rhomboid family serine protease
MNPNINTINNFRSTGSNDQMSFSDKFKAGWAQVPLFVRFVIISTVSLYLISWIISIDQSLSNVPLYTIKHFQIWRLLTSVLMTSNIINILFAFISWIPDAIKLENTSGTVRYGLNFFSNSILIQILYTVGMGLISLVGGSGALQVQSSGLWPLIMSEISILCLANPDNQVMMFFVPYPFRAVYYPWALFAFFTIMNMTIQFDILAGIAYGHLFFYYLRNYVQFSDSFIQRCENNFLLKKFANFTGFVPISVSSSNASFSNYNQAQNVNASAGTSNFRMEPADKTPVSTPFKGKGTAVGT